MSEITTALAGCLSALSPFMQITSILLLSVAIYRALRHGRRMFAALRDGRAYKYIVCSLLSIDVAIFYALVATNRPTVFVTSVVHMGLWIFSLGLARAFGDFGNDGDGG